MQKFKELFEVTSFEDDARQIFKTKEALVKLDSRLE